MVISFELKMFENSVIEQSLYLGGLSSERSSLMGPYTRGFAFLNVVKKHGTETRASEDSFAITLCSALMNLSLVMNCTQQNKRASYIFMLNPLIEGRKLQATTVSF